MELITELNVSLQEQQKSRVARTLDDKLQQGSRRQVQTKKVGFFYMPLNAGVQSAL